MARISKELDGLKEDLKYLKRKMAQVNQELKRMDNNINRHEEIASFKLSVTKFKPKTDFEEKAVN